MRPPFRSKQEVSIDAPLEAVWAFSMDLTKIPEFHPRVFKVDLIDHPAGENRHSIGKLAGEGRGKSGLWLDSFSDTYFWCENSPTTWAWTP
jgi:hypothetical protein